MKYQRILIKVSGGALGDNNIISQYRLNAIAQEIIKAKQQKIEIAILVGGGNIFRGTYAADLGIERVDADNIGMLATVINAVLLKSTIESKSNLNVNIMTPSPIVGISDAFDRGKACRYLSEGGVLIFGGGIGIPFLSTDYPAIHRALEIHADIVLMAKNGVDGVYSGDPKKDTTARRYKTISFKDAIQKNYNIIDKEAFILAEKHNIPLYLYNFNEVNAIERICRGNEIGTYVSRNISTCMF